jgi:hypothetical protein
MKAWPSAVTELMVRMLPSLMSSTTSQTFPLTLPQFGPSFRMRTRISVGLSISAPSMAPSSGGRPEPRRERRRTVPLPPAYQMTIQLLGLAPVLQEAAQLPSICARLTTDRTDCASAAAPLSRPSATMNAAYPRDFTHVPLFRFHVQR